MNRRSVLAFFGLSAGVAVVAEPLGRSRIPSAADSKAKNAVALNQVGYRVEDRKVASILGASSSTQGFQLETLSEGKTVFRGSLSTSGIDAASGDTIALADFSAFKTPGKYRLVAQGVSSELFAIQSDVYQESLRLAMRAFYGQRCGCAVDLGGGYSHAACHGKGAFHASSGLGGTLPNHGGWHDAGDYGRYTVNSGISTATLLWAWELYPQNLRSLSLEIPESGGKTPDYLAEIRWNLEWMLQMQDEDGGVWHKQTSENFCGFLLPQDDTLISYVIGTGAVPFKSTCATGDLATVMAIAARCYQEFDAAFAAQCLAAARSAWRWATANPEVVFTNPAGIVTGEYGDKHCKDEILWASAELWRTTGEVLYEQAYLSATEALPPESTSDAPSWSDVAAMAHWTYAMADRKASRLAASGLSNANGTTPDQIKVRIRKATGVAAQTLADRAKLSGYGNTLDLKDYVWGSNGEAANQSLLLLIAHHLEPKAEWVDAALGNLHYLLGRNCFGVSWVTHVGANPFQHPHHRPSVADGIAAPWPGLLSGGPNAKPADPVAEKLPQMPPMRMWIDDAMAYSMNEIAINWNAPLVFLLAAADGLARA